MESFVNTLRKKKKTHFNSKQKDKIVRDIFIFDL